MIRLVTYVLVPLLSV